jgi:protein SCO1/2
MSCRQSNCHLLSTKKALLLALVLALSSALPACQGQSAEQRRYDLKGKVLNVDKRARVVNIAHDAIPGYMEAMAMPFKLKDERALSELQPGDRIQATLVVEGDRSWLEQLVFTRETVDPSAPPTAGTPEPGPGDEVPDFSLVNQDGKRIHIHQHRGSALVLTFIYTRCPLPDYCPLMTQRFTELTQLLKERPALQERTRLLSISVDPEYDKPAVLRRYGLDAGLQDFKRWEFASGRADDVKRIATYFGLQYWREKDQIVHSLRTAVIGVDCKLVRLYRGNDWEAEDVLADLQGLTAD